MNRSSIRYQPQAPHPNPSGAGLLLPRSESLPLPTQNQNGSQRRSRCVGELLSYVIVLTLLFFPFSLFFFFLFFLFCFSFFLFLPSFFRSRLLMKMKWTMKMTSTNQINRKPMYHYHITIPQICPNVQNIISFVRSKVSTF